jgi:hypothetical protein
MQIEKISNFQNNFSNIFLIVNIKNECVSKKNSKNITFLKKICDKKEIKINYLNLCKQLNFSGILEKFINCCMILKKNNTNKTKKNYIKNVNKENLIVNQFNKSEGSPIENDIIISNTKKSKKENCCIF